MDHFRRSDTAHGKETATGVERPQAITNLGRYGYRSPDSDSDSDSDPVGNLSLGLIVNMRVSGALLLRSGSLSTLSWDHINNLLWQAC